MGMCIAASSKVPASASRWQAAQLALLFISGDCHPLAGAFLLENLRLNGLLPMKYRHGQWGEPRSSLGSQVLAAAPVDGLFDLIIGSDLLYERDAGGCLAGFIDTHAAVGAEVWIIDPDRGNRSAFNRQMADLGFGRHEERLSDSLALRDTALPAYKGRMLTYRRLAGIAHS